MKTVKFLVKALVLGLFGLVIVMVTRTVVLIPSADGTSLKPGSVEAAEARRMAENLAAAIRFPTISWDYSVEPDAAAFTGFHDFLAATYPQAHAAMTLELVGTYSLMYRWAGTAGSGKKPVAFLAHQDVVPVPEEGLKDWAHPPFEGVIDDAGIIWGRGAMDDKGMLIALMEAVERLAGAGFTPDRDIYFLFGHDEELGGDKGAMVMATMLKDRGIRLGWVIDEGSAVAQGIVPGVKSPVAMISLGEKGSTTLKFSARDEGGHSSAPKAYTAASLAAKAGVAVMENPYPLVLDENLENFLMAVAPEMPFINRMMIANLWLTRPLLARELAKSPTVAAFMHTTTAFTMMKSGTKSNILPQYGEAIVNYRIHPRDTVAGVMARAKDIIDDERVSIEGDGGREATSLATTGSEAYRLVAATVAEVFGDIPVAPTLTVQGTDARHYDGVADGTYRFMPMVFHPSDLARIHGTNEALATEVLATEVQFFEALIKHAGTP